MSDNRRQQLNVRSEIKPGKITVKIIDEEVGIRRIERVKAIRIQSDEYVLLMMEDYSPTLGEIEGKITFITAEDEIIYDKVKGFYRLSGNEFSFVIREKE